MKEATRSGFVPKHAGVVLVTWLAWLCSLTASYRKTYFLLGKNNPRMCYVVDHAYGTPLRISYWNPDAAYSTITLETMNEQGDIIGPVIKSFEVHDIRGTSEVKLDKNGQHDICADVSRPEEEKEFRFSLDISLLNNDAEKYDPSEGGAVSDKNEEELAANLLDRLKRLNKRLASMHIGADYIGMKEVKLHQTREDVNYRALWWPIIQVIAVGMISFVYARHIKGFFKTRNFV